MKALQLSVVALGIALGAHAQTAEEVFKKHVAAVGGTENWNKINTMKLTGSMSVQGMEIGLTQTMVQDKGFRMDISAMGQNGYMIYTNTGGWVFMPFQGMTEPKELTADDVKDAKDQMDFRNLQMIDQSKIAKMTMDGKDTINSVSCFKIKVTNKSGDDMECYIDSKTFYLVKMEKKVKVQDEEQEMASNFSDFKKLPEGIVVPMTWGTPNGDLSFKTVEVNKPVSDATFKPDGK